MNTPDIEEVIEVGRRWRGLVEQAAQHGLIVTEYDLASTEGMDRLRRAWTILHDDVPLDLPAGPQRAWDIIKAASPQRTSPLTHEQEEYQRILTDLRRGMGRQHSRPCEHPHGCASYSMVYSERPRCWNHASPEEREENAERNAAEQREFKRLLGLVRQGVKVP